MSNVNNKDSLETNNTLSDVSESQINTASTSNNVSQASQMEHWTMESEKSTVDCLNDDCLLYILRRLSFEDLLATERVCKRWRVLCQVLWNQQKVLTAQRGPLLLCYRYGTPISNWEINAYFTNERLPNLLIRCGHSLKTLNILEATCNVTPRSLQILGEYCPNIENLEIHYLKLPLMDSKGVSFLHNLENLVSLKLRCASHVNNEVFNLIANRCLKLQILEFTHSDEEINIDIGPLARLPNLKELNLQGLKFNDDGLLCISRVRKLTKLDCGDCDWITDQGAILILNSCKNLIDFSLESCELITYLTVRHAIQVIDLREGNLPLHLNVRFTTVREAQIPKSLPSLLTVLAETWEDIHGDHTEYGDIFDDDIIYDDIFDEA